MGQCTKADNSANHWEKGYIYFFHYFQHENKCPCEVSLSQAVQEVQSASGFVEAGTKHRGLWRTESSRYLGLWNMVTHSQVCLCFLSFVSNKNLGDQSFCLRWLLWNPKRPHQSFLAMLWPSSNGLQTHFGLALPSSRTEIHETTYIPHHEFHFEQKPAWQGKLKMEKTYQPYVSFSHCLSAVSFQS